MQALCKILKFSIYCVLGFKILGLKFLEFCILAYLFKRTCLLIFFKLIRFFFKVILIFNCIIVHNFCFSLKDWLMLMKIIIFLIFNETNPNSVCGWLAEFDSYSYPYRVKNVFQMFMLLKKKQKKLKYA